MPEKLSKGFSYPVGPGNPEAKPINPIGFRPSEKSISPPVIEPIPPQPIDVPPPAPESFQRNPIGFSPEPPPTPELAPTPAPEPAPAPAPEVPVQPSGDSAPAETAAPPPEFKEVLGLQKEAFSARREMIAFRHGKKVADLSPEDQTRYVELKTVFQEKHRAWKDQLELLPEDEQVELGGLTKLKEVEERFRDLNPEQIAPAVIAETNQSRAHELKATEDRITWLKRVIQNAGPNYDKGTARGVTALDLEGELKELTDRRKALRAIMLADSEVGISSEANPAGEARIHADVAIPEAVPPASETVDSVNLDFERSQAELRAARRNLLKDARLRLDADIEAKQAELEQIPAWNALKVIKIRNEIRKMRKEQARIDEELNNERVGFGRRFMDAVKRGYEAGRRRIRGEQPAAAVEAGAAAPPEPPRPPEPPEPPEPPQPPEPPAPAGPAAPEQNPEAAPAPQPAAERQAAPQPPEGTWKGWIKERLIGLMTIGGREYYQARRFAKGTSSTAKEVNEFAAQIQHEQNLSLEEALAEAEEIKSAVARAGREGTTGVTSRRIDRISEEITARKVSENNAKIDNIITNLVSQLESKLAKYKGYSGQNVLTEEAKNKIAVELQKRLNGMRAAHIELDAKEITGVLRQNLEPHWRRRIVAGAIETALWGLVSFVGYKLFIAEGAKAAAGATKEAVTAKLETTVWAMAKKQLVAEGVSNPTNGQIMKVAIQICKDSGIKVVTSAGQILWPETAAGVAKDTALAKGFPLVMSGAAKVIAVIKAGIAAAL
ncbi:MAG: hypothetical protein A3A26_01715 [Candidatus Zambryskibacteria bacterium RIFCSPLOWO2_01_FULL_47_14]|uniref:Uncharacterized protein n=2 Tax=Parcubacteria group TaxID=1794811 RepID=A0A1G2U7K0_9BACT|nr:MAG: hypothetical protein A3A26_01715 [Candidatus Zambryskibacteria bacterium RIFCSPLOWO2_01_FULL_47_14]